MGLTIHYNKGKAESQAKIDELIKTLANIAKFCKWEYWTEDAPNYTSWRIDTPIHCKGIYINVDEGCETFSVLFNYDTLEFMGGFTKTQYSHDFIGTHHAICLLLEKMQIEYIKGLEVGDEGDYYGNWDKEKLGAEIKEWNEMIGRVGGMLKEAMGDKYEILEHPQIKNGEIVKNEINEHKFKITITTKSADRDYVRKQIEQTFDDEVNAEYWQGYEID